VLRPQPGQAACAARLRALLHSSTIPQSHRDDPRVQDPYSLRCIPQVLGAARDALAFVEQVIGNELGAVTDNPLLFPKDYIDANPFHSMPWLARLGLVRGADHILAVSQSSASDAVDHLEVDERRITVNDAGAS